MVNRTLTLPPAPDRPEAAWELRLARDAAERRAAQELRYRVFAAEMGAAGPSVDADLGLERDRFDPHCDHLLLLDPARPPGANALGTYRLMDEAGAAAAGGFCTEGEFDISRLRASGLRLMELGRSCVDPAHRGGMAMWRLWQGLAAEVRRRGVDLLFGTASFPGTDPDAIAGALSLLHHEHLAPAWIRPEARAGGTVAMDRLAAAEIPRAAALRAMPALVKAYLRLGGRVGAGAWLDRDFGCIDVCLVLDTAHMAAPPRCLLRP